MANPINIVSLRFGPVGTNGTRFVMPVHLVEIITPVSMFEEAIIRFCMPDDVDAEVLSAMSFNVPVSNTPALNFVALLLNTSSNEYLFPFCRVDYDYLQPIIVRFTVLIEKDLDDDYGNAGCRMILNGSRRPVQENISFA